MSKDLRKYFGNKRYLLNMNTGVAHDLSKIQEGCQFDEIRADHIYIYDNSLWSGPPKKYGYKEKCDHCFEKDD